MDKRIAKTMLIHTVCILSVILAVHGVTEDGFTSRCDSNDTIFVQIGKVARFQVEYHPILRFFRGIISPSYMLFADIHRPDDPRVLIIVDRFNFTLLDNNAVVNLQDVDVEDNGMYMYRGHFTKCWELFVIDIWNPQGVQSFEEYRPVFIHATPPASRLIRPRSIATATWLLNGLNYSETTDFLELDGRISIVRIERRMNNKNVTYRIADDNAVVHEVNLTISVTYGPGPSLKFSPSKTIYTLTSGDILPDITCSTECNPTCQITWDRSGVGNVLRIGQVDSSLSGMYTCMATRNGSDDFVERSIYVKITELDIVGPGPYLKFSPAKTFYTLTRGEILPDITCSTDCNPTCRITWDRSGVGNVLRIGEVGPSSRGMYTCKATRNGSDDFIERSIYVEITELEVDNQPFIIALALLGTLQGVTMLCLVVCAVWIYRTTGCIGTCITRVQKHETDDKPPNRTHPHAYEEHISPLELQHYEGIDNTQYHTEEDDDIDNSQSNTEENYENLKIENVARPQ